MYVLNISIINGIIIYTLCLSTNICLSIMLWDISYILSMLCVSYRNQLTACTNERERGREREGGGDPGDGGNGGPSRNHFH